VVVLAAARRAGFVPSAAARNVSCEELRSMTRRYAGSKRRSLKPRVNLSDGATRCGTCGFAKCQCEAIAAKARGEVTHTPIGGEM
jgi:hypothetical protein